MLTTRESWGQVVAKHLPAATSDTGARTSAAALTKHFESLYSLNPAASMKLTDHLVASPAPQGDDVLGYITVGHEGEEGMHLDDYGMALDCSRLIFSLRRSAPIVVSGADAKIRLAVQFIADNGNRAWLTAEVGLEPGGRVAGDCSIWRAWQAGRDGKEIVSTKVVSPFDLAREIVRAGHLY